ncbi:MAG: radical SAM protein [Candidatus Cloacimonetes bacterium]|nr:radical SAM protein [Candidatus Cloacimonadota bacterium]
MKKKNIHGFEKFLFILQLKISVALYFLKKFLKNKKLSEFILILKRLNYFIGKISHNKFAIIKDKIRLDLYIPGFPSKAFFTSCNKFTVFNEKLPCTTVLISITSACTYNCEHCYQKLDKGKDVDLAKLKSVVNYLQNIGIAFFNIEGGEPFLTFDRLLSLCQEIDERSEIWINSTGNGITKEKLLKLKETNLTAIMFSLHSPEPAKINKFMGNNNAWTTMENAINLCNKLGIPVAFNSCLPKDDFINGNFEKIMQKAKEFNAVLIQIIKPKPSGGWLESGVEKYSQEDFKLIKKKVNLYNTDKKYNDFPAISAQIIEEDPEMFGCTAGGTDRFYINAKGDVQPCEFLNISYGNIIEENFEIIYKRMRKAFEIPTTCILCEKYSQNISNVFKENNLNTLPLNKELSASIFPKIKCDNPTKLYWRIEKVMKT